MKFQMILKQTSAIMRIPHAYHSRVPNITIWEGTTSVPISILIWERMLRFLGHLFRAEDTDTSKSVAFIYVDGFWRPQALTGPRARGRPHDGWAEWAWGEAMKAALDVYSHTSSHISSFPQNAFSREAHAALVARMSDAARWHNICFVARCLRHQSFLSSLREARRYR